MAKKTGSRTAVKRGKTSTAKPADSARKQSKGQSSAASRSIEVISSKLSYDGPLFRVYTDEIRENGNVVRRDVVRHNGSVVILAVDDPSKKDPLVVVERQYRHAAKQFLLEVPAGTLDKNEDPHEGAKRELLEETGFTARRWRKLARFYASPGFLGEWMEVFLAEGLTAGNAEPEDDEQIDVQLVRLSQLLRMVEQGEIHDAKTMISLMLYARLRRQRKKPSLARVFPL